MSTVERSVDIQAPVEKTYAQWVRFEDFPKFMEDLVEVKPVGTDRLHWRATIAGVEKEWDAEITERVPNSRVAWRATSGVENAGAATFEEVSDAVTRLSVSMEYRPEKFIENVGDLLGVLSEHLEASLLSFKSFVEMERAEPGAGEREG